MKILDSLNNSVFIQAINSFLEKTQSIFDGENSLLLKNIDAIINFLTVATFVASTFMDSEKLGLIILAAFAFLAAKYLFKKNTKIEIDTFDLFATVYLIIFVVATFNSSWFVDSVHGLLKMVTYFFGYLVFRDVTKTNPSYRILYLALIAVLSSTEAFIGIYQHSFKVDSLATWQDLSNMNPEEIMTRVFGTLQPLNPNLLAGYLIGTIPASLGCIFYDFKKTNLPEKIKEKYIPNIVAAVGFLATLLAIIFTGCRGGYIAIAAEMALFVAISGHIIWHDFEDKPQLRKIWKNAILFGVVAVLGLVVSQEAIRSRICSIFAQREDSSTSFRLNVYQSSFKMFKDNFITGIGVGNWTFREVYGLYMLTGFDALGAYCVPLEIAVETGIIGLLNFIAFIGFCFVRAAKQITSKISYNEKIIVSVAVISIAGMMLHGIVDTVWFRPQIQFIFWLIIAILSTTDNIAKEEK